jgi:Na+/H+-dicarboxylate symporters
MPAARWPARSASTWRPIRSHPSPSPCCFIRWLQSPAGSPCAALRGPRSHLNSSRLVRAHQSRRCRRSSKRPRTISIACARHGIRPAARRLHVQDRRAGGLADRRPFCRLVLRGAPSHRQHGHDRFRRRVSRLRRPGNSARRFHHVDPALPGDRITGQGIGILIAVGAIPDVFATVLNTTGDLAAATIVARTNVPADSP